MMQKTIFDLLVDKQQGFDRDEAIVSRWGEGTEFDAASRVDCDKDTGMWSGYLVFKDNRFSPPDEDFPGIVFKYSTPIGGNGVIAVNRAGELWNTLTGIFTALAKTECPNGFQPEYLKSDQENDVVLVLSLSDYNNKWRWWLTDDDSEGEINSSAWMFDTPGEAAGAGVQFYDKWLAQYKATGDRSGPSDA